MVGYGLKDIQNEEIIEGRPTIFGPHTTFYDASSNEYYQSLLAH